MSLYLYSVRSYFLILESLAAWSFSQYCSYFNLCSLATFIFERSPSTLLLIAFSISSLSSATYLGSYNSGIGSGVYSFSLSLIKSLFLYSSSLKCFHFTFSFLILSYSAGSSKLSVNSLEIFKPSVLSRAGTEETRFKLLKL